MIGRNLINNRLLALACIVFVLLVLAACDGGNTPPAAREPVQEECDATSVLENGVCRTFAALVNERIATPFTYEGEAVSLEVLLFKPLVDGRHPTMVFHHGSTGNGSDPSRFGLTFMSKSIALYFVERGWMVAFPQRRGRGQLDGLYDEGFTLNRSGYSCEAFNNSTSGLLASTNVV